MLRRGKRKEEGGGGGGSKGEEEEEREAATIRTRTDGGYAVASGGAERCSDQKNRRSCVERKK